MRGEKCSEAYTGKNHSCLCILRTDSDSSRVKSWLVCNVSDRKVNSCYFTGL